MRIDNLHVKHMQSRHDFPFSMQALQTLTLRVNIAVQQKQLQYIVPEV
ncbi:MAG: hypothetical protein R6V18_05460 [Desulfuromonadaceae bacterium]